MYNSNSAIGILCLKHFWQLTLRYPTDKILEVQRLRSETVRRFKDKTFDYKHEVIKNKPNVL